jgi:hypothetical protein
VCSGRGGEGDVVAEDLELICPAFFGPRDFG